MTIDKAQILQRIERLETEKKHLTATLSAYDGALQESRYWLSVVESYDLEEGDKDNGDSR